MRFQAGEHEAFAEIYRLYHGDVTRYVVGRLRRADEAEDVAHQTFMKALHALPRFEPRGPSFGGWLLAIARNAAVDASRKKEPLPVDPHGAESLRDEAVARGAPDGGDYDVFEFVDALPAEQREIVLLRHVLGFGPAEVATMLGRSPAGVSALRHRALLALEHALAAAEHPAARGEPMRRSGRLRPLTLQS
jgi:RNA polymerase sigma-70 factor (ECF subfamily)